MFQKDNLAKGVTFKGLYEIQGLLSEIQGFLLKLKGYYEIVAGEIIVKSHIVVVQNY